MGDKIPESKSQPAQDHDDDFAHEAVTIAPPAPDFQELLTYATPVPSLSPKSDQHFRAAFDAGARAGSSLSDLTRAVAELSAGLSGAKNANEQLMHELNTLRAMLGSSNEQQLELRHQLGLLEHELVETKQRAEQEKQSLSAQHDEFLAALLEEHEEALDKAVSEGDTRRMNADVSHLTQKLVQTDAARHIAESELDRAREALAKAQAQRDEAQARAEKRERERDELRAEASQLRARLGQNRSASTVPPPPVASRPPSFTPPPPALQLDAGELDSNLHSRSSPRLPSVRPRLTPPPAELERAVISTTRPPIPRASSGSLKAASSGSLRAAASSSLTPAASGSLLPQASLSSKPTAPAPASASKPISSGQTAREFPHESTRPGVGGPNQPPADFGPPPSGWTPLPPAPGAPLLDDPLRSFTPHPGVVSAASLPAGTPTPRPLLKQKPDPTTRPLIDYSLGGEGLPSETLEGVRLSSKPPRK